MLFINTATHDVQHVAPTPPCCARAVVHALLRGGYQASDFNARAYVERLDRPGLPADPVIVKQHARRASRLVRRMRRVANDQGSRT